MSARPLACLLLSLAALLACSSDPDDPTGKNPLASQAGAGSGGASSAAGASAAGASGHPAAGASGHPAAAGHSGAGGTPPTGPKCEGLGWPCMDTEPDKVCVNFGVAVTCTCVNATPGNENTWKCKPR
jgi:hypothetical protein